ncbi:MAG: galactose-1-phosphate uridylyltransferase [Candidatus Lokiarchaeota archaeon]|nr:galactose-1-phosphate uridylyltransferase [Candidatus Lokiarchaeota archaeon]
MSHVRWNPMLGEWVIITPKRAKRPFQKKERQCPFCPGQKETQGDWKVLTLENRFPALSPGVGPMPLDGDIVMEAPAYGVCKVIVTSPEHDTQIEDMSDEQVGLIMNEYTRVFKELDALKGIEYVFQFENRGKAIGVSLNHPHAQVYAMPFIPPRIQREIYQAERLWESEEECVICQIISNELKSATSRIITKTDNFLAVVPFFARLPYEVHIYPFSHVSSLLQMKEQLLELGKIIRDIARRYNKVFDENAYIMAFHTRPSKRKYPYWHFHIEFYPPWRDRTRIKYLGGVETGSFTYTNDSSPEAIAKELREAV